MNTAEILAQAKTELDGLNRKDGRVVHGWHRRYRTKLVKSGMDRNAVVRLLFDIERGTMEFVCLE